MIIANTKELYPSLLDIIYRDQIFRSESALAALQLPTHFGWVSYSTKEDSDKKTHQNHTWSQLTPRTVGFTGSFNSICPK